MALDIAALREPGRTTRDLLRCELSGGINIAMSMPHRENLHKAVRWIAEQGKCTPPLIDEASWRFDLSPAELEWLRHCLLGNSEQKSAKSSVCQDELEKF